MYMEYISQTIGENPYPTKIYSHLDVITILCYPLFLNLHNQRQC